MVELKHRHNPLVVRTAFAMGGTLTNCSCLNPLFFFMNVFLKILLLFHFLLRWVLVSSPIGSFYLILFIFFSGSFFFLFRLPLYFLLFFCLFRYSILIDYSLASWQFFPFFNLAMNTAFFLIFFKPSSKSVIPTFHLSVYLSPNFQPFFSTREKERKPASQPDKQTNRENNG